MSTIRGFIESRVALEARVPAEESWLHEGVMASSNVKAWASNMDDNIFEHSAKEREVLANTVKGEARAMYARRDANRVVPSLNDVLDELNAMRDRSSEADGSGAPRAFLHGFTPEWLTVLLHEREGA